MTDAATPGEGLTVLDYLRPVWRFKFLIVVIVALVAAGAYEYSDHKPKIYESSTEVYVGQTQLEQIINPYSVESPRTISDDASLVTTPAIAVAVAKQLQTTIPPTTLLANVTATPSSTEDFITITGQSGNPTIAADIANAFAKVYLRQRRTALIRSGDQSVSAAQAELRQAEAAGAGTAERQALESEIATLEGDTVTPGNVGQQITPAVASGVPISPKPTRDAIFAAVLALVLCIIASYLFDRTDRRVRRLEDLETLFDLPVLATVPHVRKASRGTDVPTDLQEPHRSLRVNLDLARGDLRGEGKVIMVTSALPAEGKSTIVRNLALSYRDAGARVAVIECDLRHPVLADRLGLVHWPGISEALDSGEPVQMQPVTSTTNGTYGAGSLQIAVAGQAAKDPTALLTPARLLPILTELSESNDIVLVDSTPLLSVSDALPMLGIVDGVIVVVRAGRTTYPAAARMRRTVERFHGAPVLGVVANNVSDDMASYGYAYYPPHVNGAQSAAGTGRPEADVPAS